MSSLPVAVVIPAYNAESFLSDAIESALNQTGTPGEIIIVDDGSEDGTRKIAEEYASRVSLLSGPHEGVSAARNRGIRAAQEEFVAFLDADDIMLPDRLELQWKMLSDTTDLDLSFGQEHRFKGPVPILPLDSGARSTPAQIPSTLFCRRAVFDTFGMFEERVDADDFIAWFAKAVDSGVRWNTAEETLILRRFHADNFSRRMKSGDAYTHLVKAMLDRRRERE